MTARRRFGAIRRLPSGRWQASYLGPDGIRRRAPHTFRTKTDADRWLVTSQAELVGGRWRDPGEGRQLFDSYATKWIAERPGLRPRTIDLYRWLNERQLRPHFGQLPISSLTADRVRSWRASLLAAGVSSSTCAKAYRLLRAILNTAVDDDILDRNPCRIRGAGDEHPAERPVLTINQVVELSERMPARFQALVLVTTFGSLRWGEVTALQRHDVDLRAATVTVRRAFVKRANGAIELGPPKSRAGLRTVTLPGFVCNTLAEHMQVYVDDDPTALVFAGPTGVPMRRNNFNKAAGWYGAVAALGVPQLHFHDLRHTGNTLAAGTPGTSTRDLMQRMGHDSMRAALIYQHATRDADRRIAEAMHQQFRGLAPRPAIARSLHGPTVRHRTDNHRDRKAPRSKGSFAWSG